MTCLAYLQPPPDGRNRSATPSRAAALSFATAEQNSTEHGAAGPRPALPFQSALIVVTTDTVARTDSLAVRLLAPIGDGFRFDVSIRSSGRSAPLQ